MPAPPRKPAPKPRKKTGRRPSNAKTTPRKPRADARVPKMSPRDQLFVQHYLTLLDPIKAAIAAGFSATTAQSKAHGWVGNSGAKPLVYDAIQAAMAEVRERMTLERGEILEHWALLANADARELTQYHRGACRFCWGKGHAYQWRTAREYQAAYHAAITNEVPPPTDEGGYGYSAKREPNPDCPECDGDGDGRVILQDTRNLSRAAQLLYGGTKIGKGTIEVNMESRADARKLYAQHMGMLDAKLTLKGDSANPLTVLLQEITGAAIKPVADDPDFEGGDGG